MINKFALCVVTVTLKKDINIEIGERVRLRRQVLGLSREQLSEMLDISALFLGYIESGAKGMSLTTLRKMCKSLCVSADYLLIGKENKPDLNEIDNLLQNLDERYVGLAIDHIKILIKTISIVANYDNVE